LQASHGEFKLPLSSPCPSHSALLDPHVPSVFILSHLSQPSLNKQLERRKREGEIIERERMMNEGEERKVES